MTDRATIPGLDSSRSQQGPGLNDPRFPWLLLAAVAFLAYLNAWPNVLVFDDREFLAGGQFTDLGVADYLGFFSQSLWEAGANRSALYRPLLMVSFGLESKVFGQWYAGYHLFNVLLHVVASLLVFGFARSVFRRLDYGESATTWFPLAASLLFAVHPVFSEVVNSVFNGSEIYVTIGAAGGLWYLLARNERNPVRAWTVLAVVYLWALLYRETAVSLPALAVVVLWLTSQEKWTLRLRRCLPVLILLLPLAIYMGLRTNALGSVDELPGEHAAVSAAQGLFEVIPAALAEESPSKAKAGMEVTMLERAGLNFEPERTAGAVKVWFEGLRTLVWPHPLSVLHGESGSPLWLALAVQLALLAGSVYVAFRGNPAALMGLLFFYLAILPSSRIVGALQPMFMERMLYLPSVGLVVALAAFLAWLARRTSQKISMAAVILLVMILASMTWARSENWKDETTLLEGDYAVSSANNQLLYSLVRAQTRAGNVRRALTLCAQESEVVARFHVVAVECAKANARAGRVGEAERLYLQALAASPDAYRTHFHLARLLASTGRWREAQERFQRAIAAETLPFLREFMSGVMLMDLYPHDRAHLLEARQHMENVLQLQPRMTEARDALVVLDSKL